MTQAQNIRRIIEEDLGRPEPSLGRVPGTNQFAIIDGYPGDINNKTIMVMPGEFEDIESCEVAAAGMLDVFVSALKNRGNNAAHAWAAILLADGPVYPLGPGQDTSLT